MVYQLLSVAIGVASLYFSYKAWQQNAAYTLADIRAKNPNIAEKLQTMKNEGNAFTLSMGENTLRIVFENDPQGMKTSKILSDVFRIEGTNIYFFPLP